MGRKGEALNRRGGGKQKGKKGGGPGGARAGSNCRNKAKGNNNRSRHDRMQSFIDQEENGMMLCRPVNEDGPDPLDGLRLRM